MVTEKSKLRACLISTFLAKEAFVIGKMIQTCLFTRRTSQRLFVLLIFHHWLCIPIHPICWYYVSLRIEKWHFTSYIHCFSRSTLSQIILCRRKITLNTYIHPFQIIGKIAFLTLMYSHPPPPPSAKYENTIREVV